MPPNAMEASAVALVRTDASPGAGVVREDPADTWSVKGGLSSIPRLIAPSVS
jgi:hypothetical protein